MNSYGSFSKLNVGNTQFDIYSLDALQASFNIDRLPFSLKILLENLLRNEDGKNVTKDHITALASWLADATPTEQIAFTPARVILQDFTGVPAIVDLAAMRDAISELGGDPDLINPKRRVDLVIDHSVMVDRFGTRDSLDLNIKLEFQRNRERYQFLRWGQNAFSNFRVVPPGTGIVHQVNLEYLADVVSVEKSSGRQLAYPDTLVGTDSHTTMINALGVLGWGVGGIEAEAAMLGQPITMLLPQVVGFRMHGKLPVGTTATDLVLTITQMLRKKGVVGKFVEFYGDGLASLPLADRATISNMAPEYGATCGMFPIDSETLRYMALTGRPRESLDLIETYAKAQGLWRETGDVPASYSDTLALDLASVESCIAGPGRPQDRIPLARASDAFGQYLQGETSERKAPPTDDAVSRFDAEGGKMLDDIENLSNISETQGGSHREPSRLKHGDVVIAAITSCTNTSNPAVLIAAGLLAKKARALGLRSKPWVKTSLAPGSQVVTHYLESAGLMEPLRELGFYVVGFGCTTCIGNSGPLPESVSEAISRDELIVAAVLSGNRNFEGRIHQEVRANYLASPPLVVAYALAGNMLIDLHTQPLGEDASGKSIYLKDIWPNPQEVSACIADNISADLYRQIYADVFSGTAEWNQLSSAQEKTYQWPESTYIKKPPFFENMSAKPAPIAPLNGARCLVKVGDSITTDHISPAGAILGNSAAGEYLQAQGVKPAQFNSLGSRRGNHEVMMRGTFANVRLRNQLAPNTEGAFTRYFPDAEIMGIYDAAIRYQQDEVPLIVLAGEEYGTGSSRDWAAKGTRLLGVRAVIAQSFERIHRSNLVGFGVLPLQFKAGESADSLGLKGDETYSIGSLADQPTSVDVSAKAANGTTINFEAQVRIDTPTEWDYYQHGGILHYVLRDLAGKH